MGVRLGASAAASPPADRSAGWRVVGASAEGTSHVASGAGCQDAHCFGTAAGRLVVAVADGAGSAVRAREGSWRAARAALASARGEVAERPLEEVVRGAVVAARGELERTAAGDAACVAGELADLATTLTVAVVDGGCVAVAQVGDGVVVLRRRGALSLAVTPDRSEYLNETRFVTSASWRSDVQAWVGDAAGLDAIAVATDGLQLLALDMANATPHAPFFDPLFAFAASGAATAAELAAFLSSPRVNERTDDDKTLVLAVRG